MARDELGPYDEETPSLTLGEPLLLQKLPVAFQRLITRDVLQEITVEPEVFVEDTLEGILIGLKAFVLAEKLAEKTVDVDFYGAASFEFPASVWQHFKKNHAPIWFLRRYPVRYETRIEPCHMKSAYTVEQFAAFPASPIRLPVASRGPHVVPYEHAREA